MGTRGLVGFRMDNKDKVMYNHFDSYPDELGVKTLEQLREAIVTYGIEIIKERAKNIRLVSEDEKPTDKEIKKYLHLSNTTVATQSPEDWYCLLREAQGNVGLFLNGNLDVMISNENFIYDSLFCEWAYFINFDTGMFEVWTGFQKEPTKGNRYEKRDGEYYPCKMIKEYSLDKLPSKENFLKDFEDEE